MCSISWKFALINNYRLTIDKGKGSCNGKSGERWYHIVNHIWRVMEPSTTSTQVNILGIEKGI